MPESDTSIARVGRTDTPAAPGEAIRPGSDRVRTLPGFPSTIASDPARPRREARSGSDVHTLGEAYRSRARNPRPVNTGNPLPPNPVPRRTKVVYGFGSIAEGVKDTAFHTFLLFYFNQVLGLPGPG